MTPARPPFIEGERLIYVPDLTAPDKRWPVEVVNPHPWDAYDVLYCRQRKDNGAPCDGYDHKALTHLFREVPA